jgi:DNA-binding protein H-NS
VAERGSEKMTEWLDIHVDTLSSQERISLIEELCETLAPQELRTIREMAEQMRQRKLDDAKAALLEEVRGKASELGLTLNEVFPTRRPRKNKAKASVQVKYRSPNGETWSGRGHAPLWLRQLEGGVSNVDMDGNNALYIKAIQVFISTFETLPQNETFLPF